MFMSFFFFFLFPLGGYETFNSQYPECCVDGKLIFPERTEAERNLASHCEKQSANHKPAYDQVCVMTFPWVFSLLPPGSVGGWQGAGGPRAGVGCQ